MASSSTRKAGAWYPRWFWPSFAAPATIWLIALFVLPFYVILSVAFGKLDPIFLSPEPVWSPLQWNSSSSLRVLGELFRNGSIIQSAFLRTLLYVGVATALCLLIGYPVAYFIARHSGRFKTFFLVAFIAPFWISYMMRMLAWVGLLQDDGYVNKALVSLHLLGRPTAWLDGRPSTVIMGLVYGYIPYMILPLYASLDRIDRSVMEAARDLGASPARGFLRVTLPLSRQAILAGCVIVGLPMFGDYFTQGLLAASRNTSMIGNIIVSSLQSSLVTEGASLVLILMALLIVPIVYYIRSTNRAVERGGV